MKQLAYDVKLAPSGGFRGFGPLGLQDNTGANAPIIFNQFISTAVGVMTIVAFIWFVFHFIMGAIAVLTSGGDKQALETAKKKLTTGLIGIVVVVSAVFIIDIVGTILGIHILEIPSLINQVSGLK